MQRAQYESQQKEIADVERFIERFRAKGHQSRSGFKSRVKALEKIERVEAPEDAQRNISFRF